MDKAIIFIGSPLQGIAKAAAKNKVKLTPAQTYAEAEKIALIMCEYVDVVMNAIPFSPILAFGKVYKENNTPTGEKARARSMEACLTMIYSGSCSKYLFTATPFSDCSSGMHGETGAAYNCGLPVLNITIEEAQEQIRAARQAV